MNRRALLHLATLFAWVSLRFEQQIEVVLTGSRRAAHVIVLDNGPENRNRLVMDWLAERKVIVLWNVPHTPEHNARRNTSTAS